MPPPSPLAAALSVIVPSHDTRELTLRCLQSVLQADASVPGPR